MEFLRGLSFWDNKCTGVALVVIGSDDNVYIRLDYCMVGTDLMLCRNNAFLMLKKESESLSFLFI